MSEDNSAEVEEPFDFASTLAEVQSKTPEGFQWKLRIDEEYGFRELRVILLRRPHRFWFASEYWFKRYNIGDDTTPDGFRNGVLRGVLEVLDERSETLNIPTSEHWAKLAKELQAMLNGNVR